jgi:hypothetical protein
MARRMAPIDRLLTATLRSKGSQIAGIDAFGPSWPAQVLEAMSLVTLLQQFVELGTTPRPLSRLAATKRAKNASVANERRRPFVRTFMAAIPLPPSSSPIPSSLMLTAEFKITTTLFRCIHRDE